MSAWTPRIVAALLVLLCTPAAEPQTVLFEDGELDRWVTAGTTGDAVSGAQSTIGAPGPSYRIQHTHTSSTSGGFGAGSRSVHTGTTFDLSSRRFEDPLEVRVDVCVEDPGPGPLPLEVILTVVLQQGEVFFTARRHQLMRAPNAPACTEARFQRGTLTIPLGDFTSGDVRLNLSPTAPPARLGIDVQTIWPAVGTPRAWLDNLRVTVSPAYQPLTLELTDRGRAWVPVDGETIDYDVAVQNAGPGPARTGLVVEIAVPNGTCFSRAGSTVGWRCGPEVACSLGVTVRSCTYSLSPLGTGQRSELVFAVAVQPGIHESWEFFGEARLVSPDGEELATEEELTPPAALTGPGCLCVFLPDLCS